MSALEALPIELIEHIVTNLDFCDISSLRLTSRTIEDKASQFSFTTLFGRKDIGLTTTALQNFVGATGQGRLGCLLQDCTLTGIASFETTTPDDTAEHIRLLADAFRNLKHRSPRGGLVSLSLGLAVRVGTEGELAPPGHQRVRRAWRTIWDAAIRTFRVTIAALGESQMSVGERLDVFGSVVGCSLPCDVFMASAGIFSSAHVFGSLRKLTLSLSAPYRAESEPDLEWENSAQEPSAPLINQTQSRYSQQVFRVIVQLCHAKLKLEDLDLHWYDLGRYISTSSLSDSPQASSIAGDTSSGTIHIKGCSLRGVFISETDLLHLLQTTCPETLTLTDIHLISGTYTSILDYVNGPDSSIKSYHLDDLCEEGASRPPVHFNIPGRSKFRYRGGPVGPSTLTRQAGDAKEAVGYSHPRSCADVSVKMVLWRLVKKRDFGPPKVGGFIYEEGRYVCLDCEENLFYSAGD